MSDQYIQLSNWQVALAALLILVNGGVSLVLGLGLGKSLAVNAVRMIVQLTLVGFVLEWIFARRDWYWVMGILGVMTVVAGFSAARRVRHRYRGLTRNSFVAVLASSWIVGFIATQGIIGIEPWYDPQYLIPLIGMILGNSLTGISLGLERFTEELLATRGAIEGDLALGASAWEAARPAVRKATQVGIVPIMNSMAVAGIVSLPGMMTGQIVSGADPLAAVRYQIVIMFMIASATALGVVIATLLGFRRLFDRHHRLRHEALAARR